MNAMSILPINHKSVCIPTSFCIKCGRPICYRCGAKIINTCLICQGLYSVTEIILHDILIKEWDE